MNRTLLFSFRKPIVGIPGYTFTLYDVYYYYNGGYVGFDRQDLQRALTTDEASGYPDQSAIVGTYSAVELCISGFLTRFKASSASPYAIIETTTSPCGVVCDLVITAFTVTDATTADALDGEVLLAATSSHGSLEYRLDNGTGIYQSSGLFTGLDGDNVYFARVRDSAGCIATQAFKVGISLPVYGEKYRIEFTDKNGQATRISIEPKGYTGDVVEKCGLKPASLISWQGQGQGKYKELHPSEATVGTLSATNFELLDLFSSDDRAHRVTIRKGVDYETLTLFWQGWVLPDYYSESYTKAANYQVTIKASDALGDLRNQYFLSTTKQPIFEQWSQLAVLQFCLQKTGLSLPLYTGLNTFESRITHGDDDDVLALTYLDTAGFYTYSDDKDPEPFSLLVVLEKVLNKAGCRLYQYGGAWRIVSVDEAGGAYRRRLFDAEGNFVSSDTINNVRPLGAHSTNTADVLWVNKQQNLEITPACKIITLLQDYGLKNNLIPDGFFTSTAFLDPTHLAKWTGTASIESPNRQSDLFVGNSPVYGGALGNYVPPKSSSGSPIKKTVAKKQISGVDILGSYNDVDALGRVTLFDYNALYLSSDGSKIVHQKIYWNVLTKVIEVAIIPEPDSTAPTDASLAGDFAAYAICESGFVSRFQFVGGDTGAIKVTTVTACPVTFGEKTYIDSSPVLVHQNAAHQLAVAFSYTLLAPLGRLFTEDKLAPLFRIRLQIKLGSYYLIGDQWGLTSGYTEITPDKIGSESSFNIVSNALPTTGNLTVRIFQAVYAGTARYPYLNQVRLRVNSIDIDLLIDELDPPANQLLSCPISEKFNQVPDQVEVTHGDLPDHNNAEVIYRGGIYVNAPPVGLAYTGWSGFDSNTKTIFAGTGSQGDTQLFLTGNQAYFVAAGDTLVDKQGPFLIIGTLTLTGDLILSRGFLPFPDGFGAHSGRLYRSDEVDGSVKQLSHLWQRYHVDDTPNGATSELLRILLQNQALNYSRPTQVLRGTIKGFFAFGQCISDPANNPGKVFLVTGAELDIEACRWSGEWVEIVSGDPGGFDTNPPVEGQQSGTRVFEDGGFKDWEDTAWGEWENYQP